MEKYCLLSVCLLVLQGLCQQSTDHILLKGALKGACPAPPASSQLGPVQHPAVSFPLQDQSVLPPKLCVCICNPAGVVYFRGIIILLVGAISQEANFLEICLGCAPLAKGHLSSSPFYQ